MQVLSNLSNFVKRYRHLSENGNDVILTSFYVNMTQYIIFHKLFVKLSEIDPSASTFN